MVRAVIQEDRIDQEVEKLSKVLKRISKGKIKMVLDAMIADRQNNKRQPKPPPPKGGISLRAAHRKYDIALSTLSRWVKKGYIPILLRTRNELYVDDLKLSEIVKMYQLSPGQGKYTIKQQFSP